jgi:hypothetical protein
MLDIVEATRRQEVAVSSVALGERVAGGAFDPEPSSTSYCSSGRRSTMSCSLKE